MIKILHKSQCVPYENYADTLLTHLSLIHIGIKEIKKM